MAHSKVMSLQGTNTDVLYLPFLLIKLHKSMTLISSQTRWSADRIKSEVQSENTHINWALFKPSKKKLIFLDYGHGGADVVREHLTWRDNEVVYGLMRFTFDFLSGSNMSKWLFFVWYESPQFVPSPIFYVHSSVHTSTQVSRYDDKSGEERKMQRIRRINEEVTGTVHRID